jgi:hypothetical protein
MRGKYIMNSTVSQILIAVVITALLVGGGVWFSSQSSLNTANDKIEALSDNTASGGGMNIKLLPDQDTMEATVPMEEVFSFDRNHAICWVESNPIAFTMPTFGMGAVPIDQNGFFMSMVASSVDTYEISTNSDGSTQVEMTGTLGCNTEVFSSGTQFGDRAASEPATYRVLAVDNGIGGGRAGDTFAYTVFFDETTAPLNHAIFGPEFTFTGQMNAGEITVLDPNS